jgi:pyruvate-ferredoxin/flavodoxin oxidoreductase
MCPGKAGKSALVMKKYDRDVFNNEKIDFLSSHKTDYTPEMMNVKNLGFVMPKFEFSGACAGCGETAYIKNLTQVFGDNLIIANATGCSSIYGASAPSTPYSIPWANSLFEDNAEFGFGIKKGINIKRELIRDYMLEHNDPLFKKWLDNMDDATICQEVREKIDYKKYPELADLKDYIVPKSMWIIGGDGFAYDIGYGGIDHVLSTNEDINILILDTEVYSNTGGQSSKSTRVGAIAKFASTGKLSQKKDLARMALNYSHVYVGTISLGANPNHAIKVLKEAEAYNGPSIIIAYCPCIAQGIIKGMKSSISEEKNATESGYFPLFHYNPVTKEFSTDSKADFSKYKEFLLGENRYLTLTKINKKSDEMFETNENNAKGRFEYYESLVKGEEKE